MLRGWRRVVGDGHGERGVGSRTWSLIVVRVEAADEPGEEGHLDEEDDRMEEWLLETFWSAQLLGMWEGHG